MTEWLGMPLQKVVRGFDSRWGLWYDSGMLAIIGTYRKDAYVYRLLNSLEANASGITQIHFVDDSGDDDFATDLSRYGDVTQIGGKGYNAAMQEVVRLGAAYGDHAAFLEEDFIVDSVTDFFMLAAQIDTHPYLSQVVLQRQPWFEPELRAGDMLKVYKNRGKQFKDVDGFLEHEHFFSCNPAVWNLETFKAGWPEGDWSENLKRDSELAAGRRFAITKNIRCHHDGVRSGTGY